MSGLQIGRVTTCRCAKHAWVYLETAGGAEAARVQVEIGIGRSLLTALEGRGSVKCGVVDLMAAILVAADARAEVVVLSCEVGEPRARVQLRTPRGAMAVPADVGPALLTACRLKLPILIDEPVDGSSFAEVPPAFVALLESLDLSGLGDEP